MNNLHQKLAAIETKTGFTIHKLSITEKGSPGAGAEPEIYCMDTDLTGRTGSGKNQPEDLEVFQQIADNMGEVFWLQSASTLELIYISPAYEKVWGRSRESLYNNNSLFVRSIHPEDRHRIYQDFKKFKTNNLFKSEFRIVRPDGEIRWVQVRLFPIKNKRGDVVRHTGIAIDITDSKMDEAKLKTAKAEAEKSNNAKNQFLSNLSHEIRTPLNGVLGFAELLEKTDIDSLQKQYVDNIITSSNALLNIISDLLTYSSIHKGKTDVVSNSTDIWNMAANIIALVEEAARDKGLELLLSIENNVPQIVDIDPIKVRKVLLHLLNNAIKFTLEGEVELKITFTPVNKKLGRIHFSVRDTGVGIKEKEKEYIFKTFSQADNSNTRKYGGAGLGLMICNLLAKNMSSEIYFNSKKGTGSTFYFSLDTTYEGHIDLSPLANINKIMVIDDNDTHRSIIDNTFKEHQLVCDTFNESNSAIRHLLHFGPYDLVIIDYKMPHINGIDTIKKIREIEYKLKKPVSIILMHDEDDSYIRERCKPLVIEGFLRKPIIRSKLNRVLQEVDYAGREKPLLGQIYHNSGQMPQTDKKRPTVLIAEDNKMNMMLNKILVNKILPECTILEAENGLKAVELSEKHEINIILMDIQMPEMDGIEATKMIKLKEKQTGKHIPIIAVTAGAMDHEKDRCISSGMDAFMTKPVDPSELHRLLLDHLPEGSKV